MTTAVETTERPLLDLLGRMTEDSIAASRLDPQTLMLVRFAALVAVDAPPASYLVNLGAAAKVGLTAEDARDVLAAVAPIVGTPRIASSVGKIARGIGLALDLAEYELELDEEDQ